MTSDVFKEYGNVTSVQEAIEILAVACLLNGIDAPTKIVFPKKTLEKLQAIAMFGIPSAKSVPAEPPPPIKNVTLQEIATFYTPAGRIELTEE